jgi:vacuole morphology and inheritance protein 14|tara:strand:- start:254 stop:490 length:237 start_codon:yes stop_codon:yes gene_type:complete
MIRALGQKEYEKRKQAALEVENQVRELHDAGDTEKIRSFVETLVGLAESPQVVERKAFAARPTARTHPPDRHTPTSPP